MLLKCFLRGHLWSELANSKNEWSRHEVLNKRLNKLGLRGLSEKEYEEVVPDWLSQTCIRCKAHRFITSPNSIDAWKVVQPDFSTRRAMLTSIFRKKWEE
jgi:hypothetical protein